MEMYESKLQIKLKKDREENAKRSPEERAKEKRIALENFASKASKPIRYYESKIKRTAV